jgi:hypothetical protein
LFERAGTKHKYKSGAGIYDVDLANIRHARRDLTP